MLFYFHLWPKTASTMSRIEMIANPMSSGVTTILLMSPVFAPWQRLGDRIVYFQQLSRSYLAWISRNILEQCKEPLRCLPYDDSMITRHLPSQKHYF